MLVTLGLTPQALCWRLLRRLILLPTIHVPARIYPLPFAQHEDFSDSAGLINSLAAALQLVRIGRLDHGSKTKHLNFGFGKLELDELAPALRKLRRAVENRLAV